MRRARTSVGDIEPGPDDKVYPAQKLALLLEELAAEGIGGAAALDGVGVSEGAINLPETRISLNQMIRAHQNALRLSQDSGFAYQLGLRCHVPVHGMYGFALLSSTSFRRTIDFAVRYSQLAAPLVHLDFSETPSSGVWTITPLAHSSLTPHLYRYLVEFQIGIHMALHRDVMGKDFRAQKISLTFDLPIEFEEYSRMFDCPVLFNQKENRILFDISWLDRRSELGSEVTFNAVTKICDDLIEDFRLRIGFAGRVRQFLLTSLMRPLRIGDVAKHFDVSARTLRRKLQDENTSFSQIVDDLRLDLAVRYLRETVMTVDDIGYALGFSEPTNFRQAFRRWTNATPSDFRADARKI